MAKAGLLVADHDKEGRRYLTVLDRARERVTLLLPWEHAVLVLCDGSRTPETIAEVVRSGVRPVRLAEVVRCLKFFEREGLIEPAGFRRTSDVPRPPGPRTLAGMQAAFREWHQDPVRTGQILTGSLPFPQAPGPAPVDLAPTVAPPPEPSSLHVGSTFVVGEEGQAARSLLADAAEPASGAGAEAGLEAAAADEDDPLDVAELLRAVDDEISAFEGQASDFEEEATQVPASRGKATGGETTVPASQEPGARGAKVLTASPGFAPTVVGRAPVASDAPPELLAPPREAVDTNTPTLGGSFDEETMRVPGRRRADEALETRAVEPPARRGFDRLDALARQGGLGPALADVPAAELAALIAHLSELEAAHPETPAVARLGAAVRASARGDAPEGGDLFSAAVRALVERGCCPRCGAGAEPGFERCGACGFERA